MKVVIGLSSRNEQDAIERVTRSADRALQGLGAEYEGILLNLDHSEDYTQSRFLAVHTTSKKISKSVTVGKGTAMLEAMRFTKDIGADILIFADTDLETIHVGWIKTFVELIKEGYGAVFPWRPPRWNAQDLTNQLCYPLLKGIFGASIHEPIGGEFAVSYDTCKIFAEKEWPEFALTYGVDFYMTSRIATDIVWVETCVDGGKGNHLRSYQESDEGFVIFGNKFYEVFLSTTNCCRAFLETRTPLAIQEKPSLSAQWDYEFIPSEDKDFDILYGKCLKGLAMKYDILEKRLSEKTYSVLAEISTQTKEEFSGVSWELWADILLENLTSSQERPFTQAELEAIEQIFLARTLNHYLSHKGQNTWFSTIEKQVEIMSAKCHALREQHFSNSAPPPSKQ